MSNKTISVISALLTFVILILFAVASVFVQMLVLNGASQNEGFNAMAISLICQSVGLLIAVILARWLSIFLITKFNWNQFLVIFITVVTATGFGGLISFLSTIISIPLAGIK
ncbi:MAG TPA: hypothetical protein VJ972_01855 [Anaerolineales bacterium]|nr:hypothetical protein [Anaerolineales bacterium]